MNKFYKYFYLIFLFFISFYQTFGLQIEIPKYDAIGYLQIANNLNLLGIFTDPWSKTHGNFFAPLYPYILSLISIFDENLTSSIKCFSNEANDCAVQGLYSIFAFQAFLGGLIYYIISLLILKITNSKIVCFLSISIIIVSESFSEFFSTILVETISFFIFTLFLFIWVSLFKIKKYSNINFIILAFLLGLLTLSKPSYQYLFYAVILFLFFINYFSKAEIKINYINYMTFIFSYLFILFPWCIRNYLLLDSFSLTSDYASYILVQRVAYNLMSWKEYFVSFVFWLPDFGDILSKSIFDEKLYIKLTWDHPESYYILGQTSFKEKTLLLAGENSNHLQYLIFSEIIPNLHKHILVTAPILLRGMWVGSYASFIPFIFLPLALKIMYQKKILNIFLIFAFPSLFILLFNASVSVNVVRYNIPIIIPLSLSFSYYLFNKLENFFIKNKFFRNTKKN